MKYFIVYLIVINIIAFILMGSDKSRARRGKWRISEKTLLVFAAIGGSIGAAAGMYLFRHKTKHPQFFVGIPLIFVVQCLIAAAVYFLIIKR